MSLLSVKRQSLSVFRAIKNELLSLGLGVRKIFFQKPLSSEDIEKIFFSSGIYQIHVYTIIVSKSSGDVNFRIESCEQLDREELVQRILFEDSLLGRLYELFRLHGLTISILFFLFALFL